MKLLTLRPFAAFLPFFLLASSPSVLPAQSISFAYAQTAIPTGAVNISQGIRDVAVDGAGNVYFAVNGTNSRDGGVYKVPGGGGAPITIASGSGYYNAAVDAAGNVFVTYGTSRAYRIPAGGGAPVPFGSFITAGWVRVDGLGNVYVFDIGSYATWKIASEGTGLQTQISIAGIAYAESIAFDAGNNFFAAGPSSVIEIPANGGPQITVATNVLVGQGAGFTVDAFGNFFFSDPPNSVITELPALAGASGLHGAPISLGQVLASFGLATDSQNNLYIADLTGLFELQRNGSVNFGNVNACGSGQTTPVPCMETATLFYTLAAAATLGTPQVLTQGSPNLDFTLASGSTCTGSVTAGSTCFVKVAFTPLSAGLRSGSVQIVDGTGKVLATTNIAGNGAAVNSISFVSSQTLGTLRNNYSGFVGYAFTTGSKPEQISSLGRFVAPGNTGNHLLKLVQANGVDLPGGSVVVSTSGVTPGQFAYAPLATPITLAPNTFEYLVSQETAGGDQWYDLAPVNTTSDASIAGPTYTDAAGRYYTVSGLSNYSYVPLSFLYSAVVNTTLAVNITAPSAGALLSGLGSVTVATTGSVASLQLQVDGANEGPAVAVNSSQGPPFTLALDTTLLANGSHSLTVVAYDAQLNTVTSPPVAVTVSNTVGSYPSFVTGQTLGPIRNNYSGFVGFSMTTGSTPVTVAFLGRYVAPGNSGTHLLKLVDSYFGTVSTVSLSLAGATPGTFSYAALPSPVTLNANATYFVVSQETAGGDQWYDFAPISTTSIAAVNGPVYTGGAGQYVTVPGFSGYSYVPVSFLTVPTTLSVTITSPQAGAVVSGTQINVEVATTGAYASLQLQVDGVNQGIPFGADLLDLNTAVLTSGQHTLTVVITDRSGATAVSPAVIVVVNNGVTTSKPFITGETPSVLRNNYTGTVGTAIKVGSVPITITALGRLFSPGNDSTHDMFIVKPDGTQVLPDFVYVRMAGGTPGQFVYVTLPNSVTLLANSTYYILSLEIAGDDSWYDFEPVTSTAAAQILGPVYTDGHGNYVLVGGLPGNSYVPVNFLYQ